MANARWEDNDRRRYRHEEGDDRRYGSQRDEDDARDMRRSYGGYSGPHGGSYRDTDQGRDRGFGMQGEYGAERYRPYAEDRGRQGGYGEERYGGNYGNPSRYGDPSQMGDRGNEGERARGIKVDRYGGRPEYGSESDYGRQSGSGRYGQGGNPMSTGNDDRWERRAYDSQRQSGPHRGSGPKGYKRSDERIREDLCDALTDAPHLDASGIEVTVKDSEVTLSGTVPTRDDKREAENMAEFCSGVKNVQNNLKVEHKPSPMSAMGMGPSNQEGNTSKSQSTQPRH